MSPGQPTAVSWSAWLPGLTLVCEAMGRWPVPLSPPLHPLAAYGGRGLWPLWYGMRQNALGPSAFLARGRLAWHGLLLLGWLCLGPLALASERIVNGTPTSEFPTVGYFATTSGTGLCTGTLIGPRHVLSAGHCDPQNFGGPALDFVLGERRVPVIAWITHPDFWWGEANRDLAVAVLGEAITEVTPSPMLTAPPAIGTRLTLVGFGAGGTPEDGHDGQFGTKRVGQATLSSLANDLLYWQFHDPSESTTAPGDSGGPVFATRPDTAPPELAIAAVVVGGSRADSALGDEAYNSRPDRHQAWLGRTLARSAEHGYLVFRLSARELLRLQGNGPHRRTAYRGVALLDLSTEGLILLETWRSHGQKLVRLRRTATARQGGARLTELAGPGRRQTVAGLWEFADFAGGLPFSLRATGTYLPGTKGLPLPRQFSGLALGVATQAGRQNFTERRTTLRYAASTQRQWAASQRADDAAYGLLTQYLAAGYTLAPAPATPPLAVPGRGPVESVVRVYRFHAPGELLVGEELRRVRVSGYLVQDAVNRRAWLSYRLPGETSARSTDLGAAYLHYFDLLPRGFRHEQVWLAEERADLPPRRWQVYWTGTSNRQGQWQRLTGELQGLEQGLAIGELSWHSLRFSARRDRHLGGPGISFEAAIAQATAALAAE